MAQGATIHRFDINLSDLDRNRFEQFRLQVARHPSETEAYLLTRVIAYCLELCEGMEFAPGGVSGNEPALSAHTLDGRCTLWVEIGVPAPERLQKAAQKAERAVVYSHRDVRQLPAKLTVAEPSGEAGVPLFLVEPALVEALTAALARTSTLTLTRSGSELYAELNGSSCQGRLEEKRLVSA